MALVEIIKFASGCIKSTQITQTTQIFANKICKVEYYLLNFNSIKLR